ncbi:hypothetical protein VP511E551_P0062 [Vibrio phage 511E55-1]|nr:hypothetical protein VP511E551_P0062 [Vibrio phage 511E55-1]
MLKFNTIINRAIIANSDQTLILDILWLLL